jgi:hypothetical protein
LVEEAIGCCLVIDVVARKANDAAAWIKIQDQAIPKSPIDISTQNFGRFTVVAKLHLAEDVLHAIY